MFARTAVIVALLAVSVLAKDQCKLDSDCVPATCCHSTICVNKAEGPTETCAPEGCAPCQAYTLDCGGTCGCNQATKQCEGTLVSNNDHAAQAIGQQHHNNAAKKKKYGYTYIHVRGWPKHKNH